MASSRKRKRQFYAVRVGRAPGIYQSWEECKEQVIRHPGSQYKSFSSLSEAEAFVAGSVVGRPSFQTPSSASSDNIGVSKKRKVVKLKSPKTSKVPVESAPVSQQPLEEHVEYRIEFDGASKGNPGRAGAGAVIRDPDNNVVEEIRIGLGTATNNQAEYRGLIGGLQAALDRGVRRVRAQGDSKLVIMQVEGAWAVRAAGLADLCREAKRLMGLFSHASLHHVERAYNPYADRLANEAVGLPETIFMPFKLAAAPEQAETPVDATLGSGGASAGRSVTSRPRTAGRSSPLAPSQLLHPRTPLPSLPDLSVRQLLRPERKLLRSNLLLRHLSGSSHRTLQRTCSDAGARDVWPVARLKREAIPPAHASDHAAGHLAGFDRVPLAWRSIQNTASMPRLRGSRWGSIATASFLGVQYAANHSRRVAQSSFRLHHPTAALSAQTMCRPCFLLKVLS